jgi:hypothetical protein
MQKLTDVHSRGVDPPIDEAAGGSELALGRSDRVVIAIECRIAPSIEDMPTRRA